MPLWDRLLGRRRARSTNGEETLLSGKSANDAAAIARYLGNPPDLVLREFEGLPSGTITALYIASLIDEESVRQFVLLPLTEDGNGNDLIGSSPQPSRVALPTGSLTAKRSVEHVADALLHGQVALLRQGDRSALLATVKGPPTRALKESQLSRTTRGPRVAFIEDIDINIGLIRRELPDPHLRLDQLVGGSRTQTRVCVGYIDDIARPEVVKTIKERIERIDIDGVTASGAVEQLIEDHPLSLFPQMIDTELPSKCVAGLLEGQVVILVAGTPFTLLGPATFVSFFQAKEDYNERFWLGTMYALLRYIALAFTLTLPALYVALSTYNPELLPLKIASSISLARSGVPFPPIVEALLFELVIDLLREMGLRLPSPLGQSVGVVGGIVLGDASVRSGLVSPAMLVVVVLTTISTFVTPVYSMAQSLRLVRLPLMIIAAVFGIYGLTLGLLVVLAHLCSLESMGIPYLSPFAPLRYKDLKDTFIRVPWQLMRSRPTATSRVTQRDRQDEADE